MEQYLAANGIEGEAKKSHAFNCHWQQGLSVIVELVGINKTVGYQVCNID